MKPRHTVRLSRSNTELTVVVHLSDTRYVTHVSQDAASTNLVAVREFESMSTADVLAFIRSELT